MKHTLLVTSCHRPMHGLAKPWPHDFSLVSLKRADLLLCTMLKLEQNSNHPTHGYTWQSQKRLAEFAKTKTMKQLLWDNLQLHKASSCQLVRVQKPSICCSYKSQHHLVLFHALLLVWKKPHQISTKVSITNPTLVCSQITIEGSPTPCCLPW